MTSRHAVSRYVSLMHTHTTTPGDTMPNPCPKCDSTSTAQAFPATDAYRRCRRCGAVWAECYTAPDETRHQSYSVGNDFPRGLISVDGIR